MSHRFWFSFPTAKGKIDVSADSYADALERMKKTGVKFNEYLCEMKEIKPRGDRMSESTSVARFYIDDRVGCIAVRDRTKDDEWAPGLHSEMDGVMAYWHRRKGPDGSWGVQDWQIEKANTLCDNLNAQQTDRLTLGLQNIAQYAVHPQAKEMARHALDLDTPLREMVPLTYKAKDSI
jgi:hypothetical protein